MYPRHRLNIIDVVSILPFFIEMALKSRFFAVTDKSLDSACVCSTAAHS